MTNEQDATMASFIAKKKKYRFQVDICLEELLEVPFVSAVLFAKLRLLEGGNFQDFSVRKEVCDHKVRWNSKFSFPCKMTANASTGVLEKCCLRISIRKECKGGRSFDKLGFVDLNLAEFAGAGVTYKKALLEGYDTKHRQDNSMLKFSITLSMTSGDVLFKVPSSSLKQKTGNSDEQDARTDTFSSELSSTTTSTSLPKKRPNLQSDLLIGQTISESNVPSNAEMETVAYENTLVPISYNDNEQGLDKPTELGHSRNSSNTSQLSKASGYSSTQSHSRQSSSGDSGHIRNTSANSLVLSETGSLDRAKAAYERRKKNQPQDNDGNGGAPNVPGRVEVTRVNPDDLIEELLKSTNFEPSNDDDPSETSGLQLFIAKDGTAAVGSHEVKSQMSTGVQVFKQVVMDENT